MKSMLFHASGLHVVVRREVFLDVLTQIHAGMEMETDVPVTVGICIQRALQAVLQVAQRSINVQGVPGREYIQHLHLVMIGDPGHALIQSSIRGVVEDAGLFRMRITQWEAGHLQEMEHIQGNVLSADIRRTRTWQFQICHQLGLQGMYL